MSVARRAPVVAVLAAIFSAGAIGCRARAASSSDAAPPDGPTSGGAEPSGSPPTPAGVGRRRVFVANRGKLVGAFSGFAWVAAADGTRFDVPEACNEHKCFRGTDGLLCARGQLGPRLCEEPRDTDGSCPKRPWAAKIGFDVRREGGPWGPGASRYIAIAYRGASRLRLAAHRAGEGDREYCIDGYESGALVTAAQLRTDCEREGGEPLGAFDDIDKLTLEVPAPAAETPFDVCITAIDVGDAADAG